MTLNFPNRYVWLLIGIIMLILLQSGCVPIQAPPAATSKPAEQTDLSIDNRNETTSPNGEWTATTRLQYQEGSEDYYNSLVITHTSGSPSYTLVDDWNRMGLGYIGAVPFTWSQDGNRFYYTNVATPDGCGILINGTDLYQVDLATGETVEILGAYSASNIGLSPNEQHVAYFVGGDPTVYIRDLSSNETASVDITSILSDDQAGAIVWSPDSNKFAFVIAHNPCMGGWAESTSIYSFDMATLRLTPHVEQDDRLLVPVAWTADEILMLHDDLGEQHTLDLTTNTITQ